MEGGGGGDGEGKQDVGGDGFCDKASGDGRGGERGRTRHSTPRVWRRGAEGVERLDGRGRRLAVGTAPLMMMIVADLVLA